MAKSRTEQALNKVFHRVEQLPVFSCGKRSMEVTAAGHLTKEQFAGLQLA
ncbi:MAG: hypothetical protein IPJ50_01010 [Betaproteobacteria bacterium]|nr:hypothetical protein [Betaproteobacteria bacterium]